MIALSNVCKTYSSHRGQITVVRDISFEIASARSLALMGRSGSGKTTLLYLIGGLERPDSGEIICFDKSVHSMTSRNLAMFLRQHVGFMFQFGNLLSFLTVAENIAFPLRLNGISGRSCSSRVQELLEKVGLADAAKAMPAELSGGEIQRIAFARAIAHHPLLLLADEPTASLDSGTANTLMHLMFTVGRQEGRTTIVATHDPDVSAMSDKVLHLRDGRLADGR